MRNRVNQRGLALKTEFFDRSKSRFNRLNPEKLENFENLEIFRRNICKTNFYNMKFMLMIPNVFKNFFSSIKSIFIKIQKFSSTIFTPNPKKY